MSAPLDDVVIHRSRQRTECVRVALVLKAMSIEHDVRPGAGEWLLTVPPERALDAAYQIDTYIRENRGWPKRRIAMPFHAVGFGGVMVYGAVLLLVAVLDSEQAFGLDWFGAGRVHTDPIRHGEWWRTLTALTLHLDVGHLVGNLLLGSVFGLIAGQLLGNGLAWFSILVAGAFGNAVSALVQPADHMAVGASTAVFAALGLLAAYVWRRRHELKGRWAVRWAPVIGAVALLAYTGSGGERTDVVAHLSGFLAGAALGTYYGWLEPALGARGQRLLGAGALALLTAAWAIALAAHG